MSLSSQNSSGLSFLFWTKDTENPMVQMFQPTQTLEGDWIFLRFPEGDKISCVQMAHHWFHSTLLHMLHQLEGAAAGVSIYQVAQNFPTKNSDNLSNGKGA